MGKQYYCRECGGYRDYYTAMFDEVVCRDCQKIIFILDEEELREMADEQQEIVVDGQHRLKAFLEANEQQEDPKLEAVFAVLAERAYDSYIEGRQEITDIKNGMTVWDQLPSLAKAIWFDVAKAVVSSWEDMDPDDLAE